jgi:hypothetical protein
MRQIYPVLFLLIVLVACHGSYVASNDLDMRKRSVAPQLLDGFYQESGSEGRWVDQQFAVVLRPPEGAEHNGARLQIKLFLPDQLFKILGPLTLAATADTMPLDPHKLSTFGPTAVSWDIPPSLMATNLLPVSFNLDKSTTLRDSGLEERSWPKRLPFPNSPFVPARRVSDDSETGTPKRTIEESRISVVVTEISLIAK